jgi:cellulose synthase operon protein C
MAQPDAKVVRLGEGTKADAPTAADVIKPFPTPELSAAVRTMLDADYLKDSERAAARVRHGVWTEDDLADAKLRAQAAVIRGDWLDASLSDASADPLDRAEAALRAGRCNEVATLLAGEQGGRATRLKAEAMLESGRIKEGLALLEQASSRLGDASITQGDELAEIVRCELIRSRWREPGSPTHQELLAQLARARDELDRLSWRAFLVEAMLLYERDKYEEVGQAVEATLALNPSCAEAYWLYGQVCVDTFDFPRAESVAARLDLLAAPSPSVHAACLRSYIRQRQNEGEAAEAQLEKSLAAYPQSRLLLGYRAASVATQFDFAKTDAMLEAYAGVAPGSPAAHFLVGRAMSGSRQYPEAAAYLAKAAEMAPYWSEPIVELGLCELQAGRDEASRDALERAVRLDPLNNRAANSLTLLKELGGYVSAQSEHFTVRCKAGVDEVVAREMLEPLERIYARVTGREPGGIDHRPAGRTVVELYPNHRWFGVRITGMPALHTIAAATGPVIAMEAPREGAGHMGAFDWRRVVQHEYTHTVTLSRTRNRLPHWFTEAGAVYLEDSPRDYSTVELLTRAYETETLFDLDTINIMFVRPRKVTDRSQAYAQGHMMYEFIIDRFGADKPLELMDLYAKGVREAAAFQQVLGTPRERFVPEFKAWMKGKLEQWGMLPTEANPSVTQLLERERNQKPLGEKPEGERPEGEKPEGEKPDAESANGATPEQLAAWIKAMPSNPFVLEQQVSQALKTSRGEATEEMLPLLERYAAARPVDPLPHKVLASYLLANGRGAEAVEHLEYLDAREQRSPGFAAELAKRYAAAGDMQRALAKASRATQVAPYDASYRELAAAIAIRAKAFGEAERHIRALIALEPDREVHKQRLEALLKMSKEPSKEPSK